MTTSTDHTVDVTLLGGLPSPFSNRVQIALNLKSIHYKFIEETFVPKSELLLNSNPVHKKIPVLFHRDKPVCESLVILEYIDDVWSKSPSLLPSDPYDRAIARFWAAYIDTKWFISLGEALIHGKGEAAKAAARDRTFESTELIEAAYWECSDGKPYFGGDKIGYLDLALGCFLGWIKLADEQVVDFNLISETKTPGLFRWADKFLSNDAVNSVFQDPDKLLPTYNMLIAMAGN